MKIDGEARVKDSRQTQPQNFYYNGDGIHFNERRHCEHFPSFHTS